jgi:hypothetical protein
MNTKINRLEKAIEMLDLQGDHAAVLRKKSSVITSKTRRNRLAPVSLVEAMEKRNRNLP